MSDSFEYDVFLSYSSKNKKKVHKLAKRLKKDRFRVWLDAWEIKPGDPISLKIQHGIEQSRTLVMCMSRAYFDSEWGTLEHHTLLFRDPTNARRRFIPLLLTACTPPDVIAQFAHIDWRTPSDEAYKKLLVACHEEAETEERTIQEKQSTQARMILKGHTNRIWDVVPTPDGKAFISVSGPVTNELTTDLALKVWDLKSGKCRATLKGHKGTILGVAITPDGKNVVSGSADKTLKVWDLETGTCSATFRGHRKLVRAVPITNDGKVVVSISNDSTLKVWDLKTGQCRTTLEGHNDAVLGVTIASNDTTVISGSGDKTLKVWDIGTGQCHATFKGHTDIIWSVAITPNGKTIVSGSRDKTLKVWDLETGKCSATFEGHTDQVLRVIIIHDGRTVISSSGDATLKVWDLETGHCRATFKGHTKAVRGLAVTPDDKMLISGSDDTTLRVWDLAKPGASVDTAYSTRYTNAKVILAGDTGVGKSGLAIRLVKDQFEPTISTDGHWASQFNLPHKADDKGTDREIWLWDFAGQLDYRLIHQLFMDETELAVFVFNPQQENPFEGLGQWDSDLEKAARRPFKKLLVAGRCDRGGLVVSKKRIEEFRKERKFAKLIETSAQTGDGCDELRQAIVKNIDWDSIPWTATSRLFKRLKEEIVKLRDEGIVLLRMAELKQQLEMRLAGKFNGKKKNVDSQPLKFTIDELRAVVSLLAGPGLVWKLEFGDFVLLQPERVNAYASAVVRKVRKHTDEIGCILEQDIVDGKLDYQDMERLPQDEEAIVLRAMHQTLVDHGICLREETEKGRQLVMPSLFKRERPELEKHPAIFTSYKFRGGADEIYATLIVRLHHTSAFDNDKLWKFAADFKTPAGKRVGIKMVKKHEGAAELTVYCESDVPEDTKVMFIKYVHEHLLKKGVQIKRHRHYVCPHCGHPVRDSELAREILEEEGKKAKIRCQQRKCDKLFELWDLIEQKFASEEFQQRVRELEEQSQTGIDTESKELILIGHAFSIAGEAGQIFRPVANSDWGIDGEIEFKNDKGNASGKRVYLQLKSGDSYLYKRKRDGKEIFTIKNLRHAEYWHPASQNYPVMLVIRTSDGAIRWMNVSDYLEQHGKKTKQIVFEGEPFTALNLARLRGRVLHEPPSNP